MIENTTFRAIPSTRILTVTQAGVVAQIMAGTSLQIFS